MDTETATNIAKTSLDFIPSVLKTEDTFLPLSSLPYPKDKICEAIKQYLASCNLSAEEQQEIKMKYALLANFLEEDKIQFIEQVDHSLEQIDMEDNDASRAWTEDSKNDADYKKYLTILAEIDTERKKLEDELIA